MSDPLSERRALKDQLLERAFTHAAFDGWTRRTLLAAAADLGLDRHDALRLFPGGPDALVAWIGEWADARMLEAVPPERLEELGTRAKIALLVRARFEALTPHRESVRRAILLRGMPRQAVGAIRGLWQSVDRIWEAAGYPIAQDQGVARYTRRVSLAGVLVTTTFFWLEDRSPGVEETWAFLDRRIEDVMRFGKLTARAKSLFPRPTLPGAKTGRSSYSR